MSEEPGYGVPGVSNKEAPGRSAFLSAKAKESAKKAEAVVRAQGESLKSQTEKAGKWTRQKARRGFDGEDLTGLSHRQKQILGKLLLFEKMEVAEEVSVRQWLLNDKQFQDAFERRKLANLKRYSPEIDEALVVGAKTGDAALIKLYNIKIGLIPAAGSEYVKDFGGDSMKSLKKDVLEEKIQAVGNRIKKETPNKDA